MTEPDVALVALLVAWVAAITVGATLGTALPDALQLELVIPLFLIGEVVPRLTSRATNRAVGVAVAVGVVGTWAPLHLGTLLALGGGLVAAVVTEGSETRGGGAVSGRDADPLDPVRGAGPMSRLADAGGAGAAMCS